MHILLDGYAYLQGLPPNTRDVPLDIALLSAMPQPLGFDDTSTDRSRSATLPRYAAVHHRW